MENVDQLMDDLCQGAEMLLEKEETILFMGTVLLLTEANPNQNIKPRDPRALPSRIDNVIDGQQRISTFALLATLLYTRLKKAAEDLRSAAAKSALDQDTVQESEEVEQEIQSRLATVAELFSVDLKRGNPKVKPVIIRGSCRLLEA